MSKKIIVIITFLSIVMTMVILPISSSAATVPSNYKSYALTSADLIYLYNNGYLELTYTIAGTNATTELTEWRFTSSAFGNHNIFYTPIYPTVGSYSLSFDLKLPFSFVFRSWLYYAPNIYASWSTSYDRHAKGLLNSVVQYSEVGDTYTPSLDYANEIWGVTISDPRAVKFNPYNYSSGSSVYALIDEYSFSYTSSTSRAAAFVDFGSSFSIMVSPDTYSRLEGQSGFGTGTGVGGEPSWGDDPITPDIGGDPSDPGGDSGGGTDLTPLISYLESLNSENQSTVDTIQSQTDTAIEGLSSSSEQAMDFFNESESLKTDIIGSTEDFDSFIDSLDLSEEISVTYDGDSYTFDPMQGLDLIGGRIKSLFSFPLFYFIIFMLFFLALASYVIYGRA